MQLITVTILLLIHGNPMATVFTKLYIYMKLKDIKHAKESRNNSLFTPTIL